MMGRMPYQIITHMFSILGWKRFECNTMFKFVGVDTTAFQSMLRRFCVIEVKSKFTDREFHKKYATKHGLNLSEFGVHPRDPHAAEVLVSGAGRLSLLRMKAMFEQNHSQDGCRELISDYLFNGGDNGVTVRTMAAACPGCTKVVAPTDGVTLSALGLWANEDQLKGSITSPPSALPVRL